MSYHALYQKWLGIKKRCFIKTRPDYKYYGGRGIKMCKDWIHDFSAFYAYVKTLPEYDLNLTLDRIDNDGDYESGNLRWVNQIALQ